MQLRKSFGSAVIFCFVLSVFPGIAQAPQDKGNRPQTPNGGGRPGGDNNNRPNPGGGNNGGSRPNPGGNNGGGRPNPGGGNNGGNRPGPGNGNGGRPQPSRPQPSRPTPGRPGTSRPPARPRPPVRPSRPPQWGRPPQHRPSYNFRPADRGFLLRFYGSRLAAINRTQRIHFAAGGFFPYADIQYLSPIPPDLYGQLPPPPLGYSMGYYDGYVVVYDPVSYFVANVIDLLQ